MERVLIHSQEYPFEHLKLDKILKDWYLQKRDYINLFGGKPIIRMPEKITFEFTDNAKSRKFENMLNALSTIVDTDCTAANGLTFEEFLVENQEGFFENRVVYPHPDLKINKNMKLLKCFKYFLPSFTVTRNAQDLASHFIQDTKIEGYLYFSVHPMDFLLLSENNSKWRSCHSLDGDYRSGNLSYMLDHTTFVAYLANEEPESLRALPDGDLWLNKKWRMLVHSDAFENVVYYNRQYPFDSDELEGKVYEFINTFVGKNKFRPPNHNGFSTIRIPGWEESLSLDHSFILGGEDCIYDTRDVINQEDFLGYCDLIYSPYYNPVTSIKKENPYTALLETSCANKKKQWDEQFHLVYDIKIGAKVPCVKCGRDWVKRNNSFLCDDCIAIEDADEDYFLVCNVCGSRIYDLNDAVTINGELLCKTCASAVNKEREGDI